MLKRLCVWLESRLSHVSAHNSQHRTVSYVHSLLQGFQEWQQSRLKSDPPGLVMGLTYSLSVTSLTWTPTRYFMTSHVIDSNLFPLVISRMFSSMKIKFNAIWRSRWCKENLQYFLLLKVWQTYINNLKYRIYREISLCKDLERAISLYICSSITVKKVKCCRSH